MAVTLESFNLSYFQDVWTAIEKLQKLVLRPFTYTGYSATPF